MRCHYRTVGGDWQGGDVRSDPPNRVAFSREGGPPFEEVELSGACVRFHDHGFTVTGFVRDGERFDLVSVEARWKKPKETFDEHP